MIGASPAAAIREHPGVSESLRHEIPSDTDQLVETDHLFRVALLAGNGRRRAWTGEIRGRNDVLRPELSQLAERRRFP